MSKRKQQSDPVSRLAKTIEARITDVALTCVWSQWHTLGASASASNIEAAVSMIDPEALILFSLQLRDRERRLEDFLGWWSAIGSRLLGVQRMLNLARRFPEKTTDRLGAFASLALEAGDRRWSTLASRSSDVVLRPRGGKGRETPALDSAPALMLRLRAGFGVGAKADLLAFLLGMSGQSMTTTEAADATGYTEVAIRGAAQEMLLARFMTLASGNRTRYMVEPEAWAKLLGLSSPRQSRRESGWPYWRDWGRVFPLLASVLEWGRKGGEEEWSEYVRASRMRDLFDQHAAALVTIGASLPEMPVGHSFDYLEACVGTIEEVAVWVERHL